MDESVQINMAGTGTDTTGSHFYVGSKRMECKVFLELEEEQNGHRAQSVISVECVHSEAVVCSRVRNVTKIHHVLEIQESKSSMLSLLHTHVNSIYVRFL